MSPLDIHLPASKNLAITQCLLFTQALSLILEAYSFLPYPDTKYSGLVSSISEDPPVMNWIYVDRDTFEVKFGTRPYAEHNLNGPFDCTREERRLNFGGWEGFMLVKEGDFWALYFDRNNDDLKGKVAEGAVVLEVELLRKESRGRPLKRDDAEAK